MHDIQIASITSSDLELFKVIKLESLKIEPQAFDTPFEEASAWDTKKWESKFKELTDTTKSVFLFARVKDKVVGFAYVRFTQRESKKHIADFDALYVSKEFRGQGIASKLCTQLIDTIRTHYPHIVKISLSVYEKQEAAISMYKKLGFKVYGEFEEEFFINGEYLKQYAMDLFL